MNKPAELQVLFTRDEIQHDIFTLKTAVIQFSIVSMNNGQIGL